MISRCNMSIFIPHGVKNQPIRLLKSLNYGHLDHHRLLIVSMKKLRFSALSKGKRLKVTNLQTLQFSYVQYMSNKNVKKATTLEAV